MIFHVLNRGVGRMRLFLKDADFEAFERSILKTLESRPMGICAYCQVVRYVERNALRANLVVRAEDWRWSSLWRRVHGTAEERWPLSPWPLPRARDWTDLVNRAQTEAELEAIRRSVTRGQPYGSEAWTSKTAGRLGLESTMRRRGRPRQDGS